MQNQIEILDVSDLRSRKTNPRIHTKRQIRQLAESIKRFGFINPILIDSSKQIIAGHGRLEGAKLAGLDKVPTLVVDHLTPAQIRAYVIADNKLAEKAGWDDQLLALELRELEVELDFDITILGFETPEIDLLLEPQGQVEETTPLPPCRAKSSVTKPGDLWTVGEHRLFCASALESESFERLLGGQKASLIFTDPPYNVPIRGHVSRLGKVRHGEFLMATGEMTPAEFEDFLAKIFRNLATASTDGSLHYVCMDWRHLREVMGAGDAAYTELKHLCIWAKTNAGMGSFYRSQHELILVFKNGTGPHINNIELGKHGRYRTNVWTYPGMNSFSNERGADLSMHPTVKPVQLVADVIMDASNRRDLILDAFAGSGTTLLAAAKTGRRAFGIELDPYYVDVTLRRLKEALGLDAIDQDGRHFGDRDKHSERYTVDG